MFWCEIVWWVVAGRWKGKLARGDLSLQRVTALKNEVLAEYLADFNSLDEPASATSQLWRDFRGIQSEKKDFTLLQKSLSLFGDPFRNVVKHLKRQSQPIGGDDKHVYQTQGLKNNLLHCG